MPVTSCEERVISVRSWCPLLLPSRRSSPCKLRPPALERPECGGLRCCGPCGRGSERLRCRCRAKPGLRVAVVRIFDPRPVPLVRCLCNGGGECGYRRACCSHGAGGGGPGGWPSRTGGGSLLSMFPGPRPRRRELLAFGRSPAATRERLGRGGWFPPSGWCDICH